MQLFRLFHRSRACKHEWEWRVYEHNPTYGNYRWWVCKHCKTLGPATLAVPGEE